MLENKAIIKLSSGTAGFQFSKSAQSQIYILKSGRNWIWEKITALTISLVFLQSKSHNTNN